MPRITETLIKDIDAATGEFAKSPPNDRAGGITLDLVSARALVEIADSLKAIQSALEPIGQIFAEASEIPIKLETASPDITPPQKARSSKKGS